jgi:hypothetical protein
MPIAKVHRISAASPDDVSGIEPAIAAKQIDPKGVVAVLGKTEGNGLVNDYARGYAAFALKLMFERHLGAEQAEKICLVMSGGTEGGMFAGGKRLPSRSTAKARCSPNLFGVPTARPPRCSPGLDPLGMCLLLLQRRPNLLARRASHNPCQDSAKSANFFGLGCGSGSCERRSMNLDRSHRCRRCC